MTESQTICFSDGESTSTEITIVLSLEYLTEPCSRQYMSPMAMDAVRILYEILDQERRYNRQLKQLLQHVGNLKYYEFSKESKYLDTVLLPVFNYSSLLLTDLQILLWQWRSVDQSQLDMTGLCDLFGPSFWRVYDSYHREYATELKRTLRYLRRKNERFNEFMAEIYRTQGDRFDELFLIPVEGKDEGDD